MSADVMSFNNLYKILRTLEIESPDIADEIILDAGKMADIVKNDTDTLAKLVSDCSIEITRFLDKKTLESVNEVLSRSN
jgi:hypothetical protein